MTLYFFHLRDGVDILLDPEGREIESADLIAGIALKEARAIIGDEARSGTILLDKHIDVEDESGTVVHRLPFTDAVKIVAPTG
jgi:hypothetical protein